MLIIVKLKMLTLFRSLSFSVVLQNWAVGTLSGIIYIGRVYSARTIALTQQASWRQQRSVNKNDKLENTRINLRVSKPGMRFHVRSQYLQGKNTCEKWNFKAQDSYFSISVMALLFIFQTQMVQILHANSLPLIRLRKTMELFFKIYNVYPSERFAMGNKIGTVYGQGWRNNACS